MFKAPSIADVKHIYNRFVKLGVGDPKRWDELSEEEKKAAFDTYYDMLQAVMGLL